MNTETIEHPAPVTALTLPQRAAVALSTASHEIKLYELLTNSAGILVVTNKAGRDQCHTAYMVLKNTRISIKSLSDEATEDAKSFTKAVTAESLRLIAITSSEEERLQTLRDGFDTEEKERKEALIAAEMARTDAIRRDIQDIQNMALLVVGKNSVLINAACEILREMKATPERFSEFLGTAEIAISETHSKCESMLINALAAEQAEAQRLAAIAAADLIREQQAAENARVAAENQRITAEQAAMAKKLADQQTALDLAVKQQVDAAAVAIQAAADIELKASAERDRVNAAVKAQLEQQAAHWAAERKAFADQRDTAHDEALAMDLEFDIAVAEAVALASRSIVLPESIYDMPRTSSPTSEEIIQVLAEHYDESPEVVADWLSSMVFGVAA